MMIIDKQSVGMWYVPTFEQDFAGMLREVGPGQYEFTCRIRYYRDDKIGKASADEKSWYGGQWNLSKDEAISRARQVVDLYAAECVPFDKWELLNDGDFEKFKATLDSSYFKHEDSGDGKMRKHVML